MTTISAGGGLPIPYNTQQSYVDLNQYYQLWDASRKRLWGAADCPALWALMHAEPQGTGRCVVTGTLALRRLGPVIRDEPHVVLSWKTGESGRRLQAAVALFAADGSLRAVGTQVAVLAPKGVPLRWTAG